MNYGASAAGGVVYACARTGDGTYNDPAYAAHRIGWARAGVPCDCYHYVRTGEDARTWAQRVDALAGATAGNLVWLDVEDGSDLIGNDLRGWLETAIDELRRLGRRPGVYTRASWWTPRLGTWWPSGVPMWISGYPLGYRPVALADAAATALGSVGVDSVGSVSWHGWQFTSSGLLPGWPNGVDLSIATPAALLDLYPNELPQGGTVTPAQEAKLLADVALIARAVFEDGDPAKHTVTELVLGGLFPRGAVAANDPNVVATLGKIVTAFTAEPTIWNTRIELERMALAARGGPAAVRDVGRVVERDELPLASLDPAALVALLNKIIDEVDRRLAATPAAPPA